ncbi:polysaccharide deacetylase family protein [bacterium]|nr:polysaccharide deacetylase family protein [bacterium]
MHPVLLQCQEILQGSYPGWIWQRSPGTTAGQVPVFTFHTVEPDQFEAQLSMLAENNYCTVKADAYVAAVTGTEPLPERTVMLTFDDGRASVWKVAYPLLKKYGFCATVFLSAGLMSDSDALSPNLEDVWMGKAGITAIRDCDKGPMPTLSWNEIEIMHRSAAVDFQCHAWSHQRIPVGPKILDFVTPGHIQSHLFRFGVPWMNHLDPLRTDPGELLGAPVYQNAPALGSRPLYIEDQEFRTACIDCVRSHGSDAFFEQHGWARRLHEIRRAYRRAIAGCGFETKSEQIRRMKSELEKTKRSIESRLQGHTVRHLAYPWGTGSEEAVQCSKDAGYTGNFWSSLPGRPGNGPGGDPYRLVRLKHDYIWRLPGRNRRSLAELFLFKFRRRTGGMIDY